MSTRSRIGIIFPNGNVHSVYCHFDGYMSGVGRKLLNHYNTRAKIAQVISNGDLSSLKDNFEDSVFYHRDKKESRKETKCIVTKGIPFYHLEEYNYFFSFKNKIWYLLNSDDKLIPLEK